MAGSIKWFVYTTDANESFAIELDESNTENVNGAVGDFLDTTPIIYAVPKNVEPRYAVYQDEEKIRTIRCVCLNPAIYAGVKETTPNIIDPINDEVILKLVRLRPERIRLPYSFDTGKNDGDSN